MRCVNDVICTYPIHNSIVIIIMDLFMYCFPPILASGFVSCKYLLNLQAFRYVDHRSHHAYSLPFTYLSTRKFIDRIYTFD